MPLSDNGTPFLNSQVQQLCEEYQIDHVKSTPYYPQRNGQVEATNKNLLRILSRMVYEEPKSGQTSSHSCYWHIELPSVRQHKRHHFLFLL